MLGTFLTLAADEKETKSQYDLIDRLLQSGVETQLHMHTKYSEVIYVLEGGFMVFTGNKVSVLRQGESIFISKIPTCCRSYRFYTSPWFDCRVTQRFCWYGWQGQQVHLIKCLSRTPLKCSVF
jgi:hypothetical protein